MDAINERFIKLRKACKKSQTEFSKVLGLSRSGVSEIESGRRNVTEKHLVILSNWDEYNVNIDWLRTGNGEMFLPNETDTLEAIRREYHLTDQQFKFVSNFLRLPENEKEIIFRFLSSVFDNADTVESKIERELDEYRAELELEARRTGKLLVSDAPDDDAAKQA